MQTIFLKNGKLWVIKGKNKEWVDITCEGEKYLSSIINLSEATLGDFFEVLSSNAHLKAVFAEPPRKEFENTVFKNNKVKESFVGITTMEKLLKFYENKTKDDIKKDIEKDQKTKDYQTLVLEITSELDYKCDFVENSELVGVNNCEKDFMHESPIESYYFTPIKATFYQEDESYTDEQVFQEIDGEILTFSFFKELSSSINKITWNK